MTLPTAFPSGIASSNSIGNLAVPAASDATEFAKDAAGGLTPCLLAVASLPFLSSGLMLILGDNLGLERGALFPNPFS